MHGLYDVGDKLLVLTMPLTVTGQLVADLDLLGIRLSDGHPAGPCACPAMRDSNTGR